MTYALLIEEFEGAGMRLHEAMSKVDFMLLPVEEQRKRQNTAAMRQLMQAQRMPGKR